MPRRSKTNLVGSDPQNEIVQAALALGAAAVGAVSELDLVAAAQLGLAHLAVTEPGSRRPVGVVSTLDVARAVAAGQASSS